MSASSHIQDPPLKHLFDGADTNVYRDDFCNLSVGTPGPDILRACADIFKTSTTHRMEHEKQDAYLFQYGATAGPWDFRDELSRFLSKRYLDSVYREDLVLTCGATHGLQLLLNTFIAPNGVIFVEDATYMIAISVFQQFSGMSVVPVATTDSGIDVRALEEAARKEKTRGGFLLSDDKPFWAMLYCIPVHHNPTGICASKEVREGVVRAARDLDFLVVCDDVYNLLHYDDGPPVERLFAVDRALPRTSNPRVGHVVSNGSFSKILAPGVRVGWLEVPGPLALQLRNSGILRSGGGVNAYVAGVITSALQLGLIDSNLGSLVEKLKGRMNAVVRVLDRELPPGCSFHRPCGGYFLWLRLPELVDAEVFSRFSRESRRVAAFPGVMFSPSGTGHRNCLRIAVAFHKEEKLAPAIQDLCAALRDFLSQANLFTVS